MGFLCWIKNMQERLGGNKNYYDRPGCIKAILIIYGYKSIYKHIYLYRFLNFLN